MSRSLVIGRDETCRLRLDSPLVSRFHAKLEGDLLEDLNSANGSFVNGKAVQRELLQEGDHLTIGPYRLRFKGGELHFHGRGLSVSCRELSFRPPGADLDLLTDINLCVEPGTFIAIVGTSGAGKSTLMKLLAGLIQPTKGQVFYDHRPRTSPEFQRSVGWVPQEEIVHALLPVDVALRFSAQLRLPDGTSTDEIERRVHYAAEQVSLSHRLRVPIERLSGGERKRVALAAEELGDPDIFFLDEPTSGLDPGLEKEIMLSLRDLARRGRTVILITHATDNILLCDRLLFLAPGGHPVYSGPPQGATKAFGVEDFAEIYRKLTNPRWFQEHGHAMASSARQALAAEVKRDPSPATDREESSRPISIHWLRQLYLLAKREAILNFKDKPNLILLWLQAPIIALILGQLFPTDLLSLQQKLDSHGKFPLMEAPTLLFMLVVSSLFFGSINSCRELVKERPIYIRERLLGVKPFVYLLSKLYILAAKGAFSVTVLVGGVSVLIPLYWSRAQFFQALLLCWAAYLGGVGLGLILSALLNNAEQAGTMVPVILILQLVLAGAFVKPEQMTSPISELSVVAVCRWSFAGLCGLSNINQRFEDRGLSYLTADYFIPLSSVWSILVPLLALHLITPLLLLYLKKERL